MKYSEAYKDFIPKAEEFINSLYSGKNFELGDIPGWKNMDKGLRLSFGKSFRKDVLNGIFTGKVVEAAEYPNAKKSNNHKMYKKV